MECQHGMQKHECADCTKNRYEKLLDKHGICEDCGEMYSHDIDSPFASCKCKTSEWHKFTPYMVLESKLYDVQQLRTKALESDDINEIKDLLNEMLFNEKS